MVRKMPFSMGSQMGIMRFEEDDMAFLGVIGFAADKLFSGFGLYITFSPKFFHLSKW